MSHHPYTTTRSGIRWVGEDAQRLLEAVGAAAGPDRPALAPGAPGHRIYGARFTVKTRDGSGKPATILREALTAAVQGTWAAAPRLDPSSACDGPIDRLTGVRWRTIQDDQGQVGHLLWRQPHPAIRGTAFTSHVVIEEREFFTRLALQAFADAGLEAIRGALGVGQAHPSWLAALRDRLEFTFEGRPVTPIRMGRRLITDYVMSTLCDPNRTVPIAVLAPEEDGSYLIEPDVLLGELFGLAHLVVLDNHDATFALSDTIGDRRLSAYWGACRIYLPGFTPNDDGYDHPLLTRERIVDPMARALSFTGALGLRAGRAMEVIPFPEDPAPPSPEPEPAREPEETVPERTGLLLADAPAEPPVEERPGEDLPEPSPDLDALRLEALRMEAVRLDALRLDALRLEVAGVRESLDTLLARQERLLDELLDLKTVHSVRSARTGQLERRIDRLEATVRETLERVFGPVEPAEGDAPREPETRDDDLPSLREVVEAAAVRYPDALWFLESARDSAQNSPFEDVEQVSAIFDAMARVARRRARGDLGVSLNEAFRDLGVDYRGGISKSTPRRLRRQYLFTEDEKEFDCVEHIAVGSSYDPRFCLRIYFTSRMPVESRFVIGHVGRHFEVITTS